jgi:hypothetical protein
MKPKEEMFVLKVRILPNKGGKEFLRQMIEAQRIIYNFCLAEAIKRRDLCRNHPSYKLATEYRKLSELYKKSDYQPLYKEATIESGFSEFGLIKFTTDLSNSPHKKQLKWASELLKAKMIYVIGSRAFLAVKNHKGQNKKRFNFVRPGRLDKLEDWCSSTKTQRSFHIADNNIIYTEGAGKKKKIITFPIHRAYLDKYWQYIQGMNIRGISIQREWQHSRHNHWYACITVQGSPMKKFEKSADKIAIDIGTKESVVCNENGEHQFISLEIPQNQIKIQEIKKLQKRFSRLLRLANPECYNDKGAVIKGKRQTHSTNLMKRLKRKMAVLHREITATKKYFSNHQANLITSKLGSIINIEKHDFAKMKQKGKRGNHGVRRSIQQNSPAQLVNALNKKATTTEINTYKTKLSQTCICGKVHNKGLSRVHKCDCDYLKFLNGEMHRDVLSAFLMNFVFKDKLDLPLAQSKWSALCSVLANGSNGRNTEYAMITESIIQVGYEKSFESQQANRFFEKTGSDNENLADLRTVLNEKQLHNSLMHNGLDEVQV